LLFHPHFDLCYSSSFLGLGRGLLFVPCERGVRYAGESRMSSVKLMMHGMRMLMPFLDRIAMRALIVFTVTLCFGGCFAIWVVGLLPRDGPFKVLGIGAGAGLFGEFLRSTLPQAAYHFVEPLEGLERSLETRFGKARNAKAELDLGAFDAVVLLDVLEHQADD